MHSETKTFGGLTGVNKGSKEATSFQKKTSGTDCKRYRDGVLRIGVKSFSLMNPFFDCLGDLRKSLSGEAEYFHQSCAMPTVKHPETIRAWGYFSAKGVESLTVLNTAMNQEWFENILREQLLLTIREKFDDERCLFQYDGTPYHKAKVARGTKHWNFGSMATKLPGPKSH